MSAPTRLDWRSVHISPAVHPRPRRRSRSAWLRATLIAAARAVFAVGVVLVTTAILLLVVLGFVFIAIALWGGR